MKKTGLALIIAAAMGAQIGCASVHQNTEAVPISKQAKPATVYTAASFDMGEAMLTPDLANKLRVIVAAKNFAVHTLGLEESKNYMRFRSDSNTLYWLHITGEHELPEYLNNFKRLNEPDAEYREEYEKPITLSSRVDTLADEEEYYAGQGMDTHRRIMKDFNDGTGCDLRLTFFDRPIHSQVNSIFHEDLHHSMDQWDRRSLPKEVEESIAMFIGHRGAVEFTEYYFGKGSEEYAAAVANFEKYVERSHLISAAYDELGLVYAQPFGESVHDTMKAHVLNNLNRNKEFFSSAFIGVADPDFTFNNAMLWKERAYTKHADILSRAYDKAGNLASLVQVLRKVPIKEDEAVTYLNNYVDNRYAEK